jgi:glycosyltransferase involved in cell wall biosynthesis
MAPGGIETLVLDLLNACEGGERAVVVSLEGERDELVRAWPALMPHRGGIIALGAGPGRRFALVPGLVKTLSRLRPTRVFAHHIGPLLYGGLAARLALVSRLVHVEHDAWHYEQTASHERILRLCELLLRPRHFAVSKPIAQRLAEFLPDAAVEVVPPGVDLARFHPDGRATARARLGIDEGTRLIGTVGRLHPVKGQRFLIEALARLGPECALVIAGEGSERAELEACARAHAVADRCHFLGHRDDVADILPGLDVFALPSLREGLPRAVLEAQAAGVPVVATRVGALADAVAPASGRLVPAEDAVALAGALGDVLRDPRSRHAIGAETRAFVSAKYDFARIRRCYAPDGGRSTEDALTRIQSV